MKRKWTYSLVTIFLFSVFGFYFLITKKGNNQFFKCNAEIHFEISKNKSLIEANTSLLLASNKVAILDVKGIITKQGMDFNVERKVYFNYSRESEGGYYYFEILKEEDYALENSASDELFNEVMFGNKKSFYMSITPVGSGGFELSEMLFPVAICYTTRT
ncbi:hypothetical protein [Serratia aquatilis]|uniref:FidL-like membrane protein n=1 Tax=Serratia aquatilis TaxID=1737515 RepID=A0ABV6EG54_9GAMM